MCGIAGFIANNHFTDHVNNGGEALPQQHLVDMGDAIAHRGPDAKGEYLDELVGLCHRRLSILDLSPAGNQPMFSGDGNIVIVFNGEIYNFLDLRKELEEDGVRFVSSTDTEVIIKLYEREGLNCLAKLNGMFAFALWDKTKQQLFIARDRLGKKPLYYYKDEETQQFAFGSEIKAILALPNIKKELRLDAVHDFFAYQYVPDPKSIFTHIHKLPPAHYLTMDLSVKNPPTVITEYWKLSFAKQTQLNEPEAIEHLRELIKQTTKRRMISDVPLGAFLSGGVDSSGVVATMAGLTDKPVKTCTIAFDNEKFNEAKFAQSVATQYATDHHELVVHQNVADTLEHIVGFFDEPFADPSLVPTFFVSELARKEVTVAIAGDGGDEVFAGYEKYTNDFVENQLREKFPKVIREKLFPTLAKVSGLINLTPFKRAKSLLTSLSVDADMGFYITNSFINDEQWQHLALPETLSALGDYHPSAYTLEKYQEADGKDHLSKILYTDMKTYLTGDILVKVDRMSMANSLEVRAPILDKEILEYAATLPSSLKFRDKEKKYVLKEAFKPDLSDDILYRKKMGFAVPLAQWLRVELKDIAQRYLVDDVKGLNAIFDIQKVTLMWQEHLSSTHDHSTLLWSMLMFEMWWQRYMD
ncbi:MAG: asparagine synthase (glutamine-hydrolyzing) [Alphaproteobacteria bacterium]|jgi:asparagine synthase (glutamine-hydrolysing)